jgi:hypothetical protein
MHTTRTKSRISTHLKYEEGFDCLVTMDSFLKKHTTSEVSETTHLSLVGGKYNIPYHEMDTFYKLYVHELNHNRPLYLVERVRYPCYLFIDLDNVDTVVETPSHDREHVKVSVRESEGSTRGVHIIFKDVIVNDYDHAVAEAKKRFAEDGLDTSVYRSGLRMLGSSKSRTKSRTYKPFGTNTQGKHTFTLADMYDHSLLITNKSKQLPAPSQAKSVTVHDSVSSASNESFLSDFSRIHPRFKQVRITRVFKKDKSTIIVQTTERFCINMDREHKSNHIYFVISLDNKTMFQQCYCTCAHTQCKYFFSRPTPVPIKMLYHWKNHL